MIESGAIKIGVFSLLLVSFGLELKGQAVTDSTTVFKPKHALVLSGRVGEVFATNSYVRESDMKMYSSFALKYVFSAAQNRKDDITFGHPYIGFGISNFRFINDREIGYPFALYVLQGGTLFNFGSKISLNYEWNAGVSLNWNPYDPVTNPEAIAIGSRTNAYIGVDAYCKWYISGHWNLQLGLGLSHFSNGATKLPNKGLNMYSPIVGLVYNLDKEPIEYLSGTKIREPKHIFRDCVDISGLVSFRQISFDTAGTKLAVPYINNSFTVLGANATLLFRSTYKYRWGPAVNFVYDESVDASASLQQYPGSDKYYMKVVLGEFYKRFSAGLSMYGEIMMPRISLFANLGYDVIHFNASDSRLYQIAGVKIYLNHSLYTTVGIRANHFSRAQFLNLTVGNTFGLKKT